MSNISHNTTDGKFGKIHGMARTRTYITWMSIKSRCYNPKETGYEYWGGRGIKICDRWKNDFAAFLEDMGERPEGMSIDRKDNDGDYSKENCRWATRTEQNINKRMQSNNKSGHVGIIWHHKAGKWQAMYKGKYLGLSAIIEGALQLRENVR